MSPRLPPVLLVEDNPDHALLVQRAFIEVDVTHPVWVIETVEDAIAYLAGSPPYQDRHAYQLPALVVLDITLLGGTGFDILDWIRGRPELSALPVVVLTVSADMATRERAFGLGALDYVVKRRSFKQLVSTANDWAERWLRGEVAYADVVPERTTRTSGAVPIPMQLLRGSDEITRSIRPVLVVQEDAEQGLLVQIGFQEARVGNPVTVLMSAELAIAYLGGDAPYDDRSRHPLPALLLVDLGPRERAGLEVLEWLSERPHLRGIPVVALIAPEAPELHEHAYGLGAGICVTKPANVLDLVPRMHAWARFWLRVDLESRGGAEIA